MKKILYVNNKPSQCGVYEFGNKIGNLLTTSSKYNVKYTECSNISDLQLIIKDFVPNVVIYNYHPLTMSWLTNFKRFIIPFNKKNKVINIGTIHEVYQSLADSLDNSFFDFFVAPDPTLLLKNEIVFKTGRLIPLTPCFEKKHRQIPIIGSFGFGTNGKGFEKIVKLVEEQFDIAHIRLNIPYSSFLDKDGRMALEISKRCHQNISKKGLTLEVSHNYLSDKELIEFLRGNTLNLFLYEDMPERGISSAIDWAMASGKPFGVSSSRLFRHVHELKPSILVDDRSLQEIIDTDFEKYNFYNDYSSDVILWEYENIIDKSIKNVDLKKINKRTQYWYFIDKIQEIFTSKETNKYRYNSLWTSKNDDYISHSFSNSFENKYIPFDSREIKYNIILDNYARDLYKTAINFLELNLPKLISKKIPEANVQQAFVLDTAVRLTQNMTDLKSIAVGCFEDTAYEALKLSGFNIEGIDPIINYDLSTFNEKPTTILGSYDLVISTSVIEHVEDDDLFMKNIEKLLRVGGIAILTCDFNNSYVKGDDIPHVDFRFYTKEDIINRLLKNLKNSILIDEPSYDCENPDFILADKYVYTFASIVIKRIK